MTLIQCKNQGCQTELVVRQGGKEFFCPKCKITISGYLARKLMEEAISKLPKSGEHPSRQVW